MPRIFMPVTFERADRPVLLADSAQGPLIIYRFAIVDFDEFVNADRHALLHAYTVDEHGDETLTTVRKSQVCNWRIATEEG